MELVLGDRAAAAEMARKGALLAGPSSVGAAMVARFLAEPPASSSEWSTRAQRLFPNASGIPSRISRWPTRSCSAGNSSPPPCCCSNSTDGANPESDPSLPVMLAWTCLETGRANDAAPLLRFNPIPSTNGVSMFAPFYLPRIYYLRGLLAEKQGKPDEARANYQIFRQLSARPADLGRGAESHKSTMMNIFDTA